MTDDVILVFPPVSDDLVSSGLRHLTMLLDARGFKTDGGGLGGTYGYAVEYDNAVFSLHPFCWCDMDDCPWCKSCSCPPDAYTYFIDDQVSTEDDYFAGIGDRSHKRRIEPVLEKRCGFCNGTDPRAPNFLHKDTGTTVSFYKYIGRGMEVDLRGDWLTILDDCIRSFASTKGDTL